MITLKSKKADFGINFPSKFDEIKIEDLSNLVSNIDIAKYYAIIACITNKTLFEFATLVNSKNPPRVNITPIIIKYNGDNEEENKANIGSKPLINESALSRGHHLSVKSMINVVNAAGYLANDQDLVREIIHDNYCPNGIGISNKTKVYFIEFKIVPINDIYGIQHINKVVEDPYIINYDKSEVENL